MKLTRIYSNTPAAFPVVDFKDGLNVVLGSVFRPKRRDADTHNLGKSLLAQMIDFALLKTRNSEFFLFSNAAFADFIFFLEVQTHSGTSITIRRSVKEASKAAFMLHSEQRQDFTNAPQSEWSHWRVPFERSKQLLDGFLNLAAIKPWTYRNAVAYSLRGQSDFDEPFRLSKFAGRHADWKPYLSHVLGLDGELVAKGYEVEDDIKKHAAEVAQLEIACDGVESGDELRGLMHILERDVAALADEMERFDLAPADARTTTDLVENVDVRIASLNDERYALAQERARIMAALDVRLSLNVNVLERIFQESRIYFGDQIKRDYAALEQFNRELAEERDRYLRDDLGEVEARLADIERELFELNRRRAEGLVAISESEALRKYKRLTKRFADRQAELSAAQARQESVDKLAAVRGDLHSAKGELERIKGRLEALLAKAPPRYDSIRGYFDDVVFRVIGYHANLYSAFNKEGHIEFFVGLIDADGKATKAGEGFSYTRLMCVAFDMALMRAYIDERYPHFLYHDGALETLDDRKKLNLIDVIREYCSLGVQHIITVIESELPIDTSGRRFAFDEDEIVLRLSDQGDSGRLFKMPSW